MNKEKTKILFIIVPIIYILYSLLVFLNFTNVIRVLNYVKMDYSLIVISTIFSFLYLNRSKDSTLVTIALLFTSIADMILVFHIEYRLLGLIAFCMVQLIYGLRFSLSFGIVSLKNNIITRVIAIIFVEIAYIIISKSFDITIIFTLFYFTLLLINFLYSIIFYNRKYKLWFTLVFGFLFFIMCDLFVGVGCSKEFIDISSLYIYKVYHSVPFGLEWFFYIPSQMFLTLSTLILSKNTN